jgi:uncharacterized protein (TIGR00730 family)
MKLNNVCVYCGSSEGLNPAYGLAAIELAQVLCGRDIGLVYGGAAVGLMGKLADAMLAGGGRAVGVIPEALAAKEIAHERLDELHVVASMHARKAMMAELADGFIAMPGGWGTLDEIFEMLTWAQLGFHGKPCGFLNSGGYYDSLAAFLEKAFAEEFVRPSYRPLLMTARTPGVLLDRFCAYEAPSVPKWVEASEL